MGIEFYVAIYVMGLVFPILIIAAKERLIMMLNKIMYGDLLIELYKLEDEIHKENLFECKKIIRGIINKIHSHTEPE